MPQERLDRGLVPGRQPVAHALHLGVVPSGFVERDAGPLVVLPLQPPDLLQAVALPTPDISDVPRATNASKVVSQPYSTA